jgi:hypothetical protein
MKPRKSETNKPEPCYSPDYSYERKLVVERGMAAIDMRLKDYMADRNGCPWVVLSKAEARSLGQALLRIAGN